MNLKREEIPYDEGGVQLSFNTDAETVYVDGVKLPEWLKQLENRILSKVTNGRDGTSFRGFEIGYARVTEEHNNISYVETISTWESKSPTLTEEYPHLWKRTKAISRDADGKESFTLDYQYCGSLGLAGLDAEWKEWIFKITSDDEPELVIAGKLQADLSSYKVDDPAFQANDFIPGGWNDDMQEVTDEKALQWCASRYKKGGVWSAFGNVHIFGRKPKDGTVVNNIYAITDDINEALWKQDEDKLIPSLLLNLDQGKVYNFPSGTNYKWEDSVPNAKDTDIIWLASVYFSGVDCLSIDYPIRITGPAGPGSDGNGVEFVYCVSDSKNVELLPPFFTSEKPFLTLNGLWYNTAGECSITEESPYLYARQRTGMYLDENNWFWVYGNQKFGKSDSDDSIKDVSKAPEGWNYGWSKPMLWSSWGQDGVDGDGVQYVYLRLTEAEYQFVSRDKKRWNFDGLPLENDPGDLEDSTLYKYTYKLDSDFYLLVNMIDWDGIWVTLPVTGTYTITDETDAIVKGPIGFRANLDIELNLDDANTSISTTKDCTLHFTYNGPALPKNKNGRSYVEGTVSFTRKPCDLKYFLYSILFKDNLTKQEILEHLEGNLLISEKVEIKAPDIEGYKLSENVKESITLECLGENNYFVFFYDKL